MKKLIPTLILSVAALGCVMAEAAPLKSVLDLYKSSYTPQMLEKIRSIKLVYLVSGTKISDAILLVRGQIDGKIRLDILQADKHYVACRNGKKFWGASPEDGVGELTKDEIENMSYDIAFLPVPFLETDLFKPLTPLADPADANRIKYTTSPINGKDKLTIMINAKTNHLARVVTETENGKYITSFRDYMDFDGAKFATRIQCSSPEGIAVLKLCNVEWDPTFNSAIFEMSNDVNDTAVKMLIASAKELNKVIKKQNTAPRHTVKTAGDTITKLQKEIAALDIEIKEKEERMGILEAVMKTDFSDARTTAQEAARPRYRYRRTWYYGGWRGHYTTRYNHEQKRLAKRIRKEAQEASEEYVKISDELTKLRIRRSDAQIELEKLVSDKAAK